MLPVHSWELQQQVNYNDTLDVCVLVIFLRECEPLQPFSLRLPCQQLKNEKNTAPNPRTHFGFALRQYNCINESSHHKGLSFIFVLSPKWKKRHYKDHTR